jgi:hypothetical protein
LSREDNVKPQAAPRFVPPFKKFPNANTTYLSKLKKEEGEKGERRRKGYL